MKALRTIAIAIGLAVILIFVYAGTSTGSQVCTECGEESEITEWYGTLIHRRIVPTPLSTLLAIHGACPAHAHHWLFIRGMGSPPFGAMCALGPGRNLWQTCHSAKTLNFIGNIILYTNAQTIDEIRKLALDPSCSPRFQSSLYSTDYPDDGIADPAAFQKWWADNHSEFLSAIAPSTTTTAASGH